MSSYNKKINEAMLKVTATNLIEESREEVTHENFNYGQRDVINEAINEATKKVCEVDLEIDDKKVIDDEDVEIADDELDGKEDDKSKKAVKESNDYQKFVQSQLGDRSLKDMSNDEKKQFFKMIDKKWKASNE